MKHIHTLAAAVFMAAALSSCAKMRVETEDVRPAGTPIRMAVSSEGAQTKALFDAYSFSAEGNVLYHRCKSAALNGVDNDSPVLFGRQGKLIPRVLYKSYRLVNNLCGLFLVLVAADDGQTVLRRHESIFPALLMQF